MPKVNALTPRREQILTAAIDLFHDRGYGRVAVDEIGVAVRLSGPGLYRHFHGKGEILAALFDRAIDGILSATGGVSADPFVDLEHRVRAHARYVLGNRKLATIWVREGHALSEAHRARLRLREAGYVGQWVEAVTRCRPELSARQAELAVLAALGTLNSIPSWPKTSARQRDIESSATSFVLDGLGCHPAT